MTDEVNALRRQYAFAHSNKRWPSTSEYQAREASPETYTNWWCQRYSHDLLRLVSFAEETLRDCVQGDISLARMTADQKIKALTSTTVSILVQDIVPLHQLLRTNTADDSTYVQTLRLIIQAFGTPAA